MTVNELKSALEMEVRMHKSQVSNVLEQAQRIIEEMKSGRSVDHGAHNLASRCTELSSLAGKIEQTEKIIRSL